MSKMGVEMIPENQETNGGGSASDMPPARAIPEHMRRISHQMYIVYVKYSQPHASNIRKVKVHRRVNLKNIRV